MRQSEIINYRVILLLLIILIYGGISSGQVMKDSSSVNLIREGIRCIYNMEFTEAEKVYAELERRHHDHPVCDLYRGMMIYWKKFPLIPSSPFRTVYEQTLHACIEKSEPDKYPSAGYGTEYLLANLSARGLLLLFYADNGLSSEVMPLASQTYRPLMHSMKLTEECPDLYFFSGIYNYYRDAYPRVRPIYKAVAFLFPQGNMKKGIEQLEICAQRSMALQAEAFSMLAWIRMHFENDYQKSLPYCRILTEKYPANPNFKGMYIKNLLLLKRYDEAEKVINMQSEADTNSYYRAQLNLFKGLLQEKKYKNYDLARELYRATINAMLVFGEYGKEFQSYAYFGLSRITQSDEAKQEKRVYRRKATELSDFKKMTFDD